MAGAALEPTTRVTQAAPPDLATVEGAPPLRDDDDSYEFAAASAAGGWEYVYRATEVEP